METECIAARFGFAPVAGRAVIAAFVGAKMTSEAGAVLSGASDRAIRLAGGLPACFTDPAFRVIGSAD
jgi:hypothetical protein